MFFLRNSFKYLVYLSSLLLFITNHSLSQPIKDLPFKNIVVHEVPKEIIGEEFLDFSGKKLKFNKFDHQINLINFWSTWCVPCKEEMPSIDKLVDVGTTTTVVSDWNFETSRFVVNNHIFKSYSFPNKNYGMVAGIWSVNISVVNDGQSEWNPYDASNMLIGSTFSVVAYKSTQKFPERVSLGSANTIIQVGGCAAL